MRKILLVVLVALGLFASAMPAQAAALEFKDPDGDAGLGGAPIPSESLDVLKVKIETQGDVIVWTADIKKLGDGPPVASTGMQFVFGYKWADTAFTVSIMDDLAYGKRTEFRGGPNAQTAVLACSRCAGVIDRKANKVVLKTPIASLSGGMRTVDRKFPELQKGGQLTTLSVVSNRMFGAYVEGVGGGNLRQPADTAKPAGDAPFIV